MNNKKAQLKIQEMSFMLLALVLFFVIAGLFFLVISNAGLKKSAETLSASKATSTIFKLAESPELSCGKQLCVDTDKLIVLKERTAFANYWGVKGGIIIKKLYPSSVGGAEIECNTGNRETCNTYTLQEPAEGFVEISNYVTLCRKDSVSGYSYDKCELGVVSAYIEK